MVRFPRPGARATMRRPELRALLTFSAAGVVGLLIVLVGSAYVSGRVGRDFAVSDARRDAATIGRDVVRPVFTDAAAAGDPAALRRLDAVVRQRVLDSNLVRVKIWRADGRILYSDEPRLIGTSYVLGADEQEALRTGRVAADVSDLSRPENRFDRAFHKLLEVYLPIRTPAGQSVLFEAYFRYDAVASTGHQIWRDFLPIMIGSLVALELLQIPLAWSMGRRLRRAQLKEEQLLRRAVAASDAERRRIAGDLHDGVVQDLSGVSLTLAAVGHEHPSPAVEEAAEGTRRSIRALRSMLVEIYPPSLQEAGLHSALSDLTTSLSPGAPVIALTMPEGLRLPADVESLLFRVAQEALRNVVKHASAKHCWITVSRRDDRACLEVRDDGVGVSPADLGAAPKEGHLGTRLMADLVSDAGGRWELVPAPGGGTIVRVQVPTW